MVCYNPQVVVYVDGLNYKSGKPKPQFIGDLRSHAKYFDKIGNTYTDSSGRSVRYGLVDCGRCIGCQLVRSRDWAIRGMHEASLYSENYFITFTYSDDFLPADMSVDGRVIELLNKRMRKKFGNGIRFLAAGEYGAKYGRPHYHICYFNLHLDDLQYYYSHNGYRFYTSEKVNKAWGFGMCVISEVSFDTIAYTARYILKKQYGSQADAHYQGRKPEFSRASNRPGLGYGWLQQYGENVYSLDRVVYKGHECKPPRYYDKKWAETYPEWIECVKANRMKNAQRYVLNNSPERLAVREEVQQAKLDFLPRVLERSL